MNDIQGWINLYKPKSITSFQAVKFIKKKFFIKKIGHAGTLDPLAEGILPIAIGKATKLIPFITKKQKKYRFTISWGVQTSTDDQGGDILYKSHKIPSLKNIIIESKKYIGNILQVPPNVSAVKVNGIRAYKLSRNSEIFELKAKNVFVKDLNIISHSITKTCFEIECGKGFYVRSLARDLSRQLGTFGHVSSLERINVGNFNKNSSILLDDLLKMSERLSRINFVSSSISMLDDILAYEIEDRSDLLRISKGMSINVDEKKIKNFSSNSYDSNLIILSKKGDVLSFGKLIGNLFKPNKVLI